jgi:hypothetical protein
VILSAAHVFFGLFCRKLILSTELVLLVAVLGAGCGERAGLPQKLWAGAWVRRGMMLLLAGLTVFGVFFVGFLRDAEDAGLSESWGYVWRCILCFGVVAVTVVAGRELLVRERRQHRTGRLSIGARMAFAGVGLGLPLVLARGLDVIVHANPLVLAGWGMCLGAHGPTAGYHGIAAILAAALIMCSGLWLRGGESAARDLAVAIALALSAVAGGQGVLAYHGISALYILAAAYAVVWLTGRQGRARVFEFVVLVAGEILGHPTESLPPRGVLVGAGSESPDRQETLIRWQRARPQG